VLSILKVLLFDSMQLPAHAHHDAHTLAENVMRSRSTKAPSPTVLNLSLLL
jgi:hypothetical protein